MNVKFTVDSLSNTGMKMQVISIKAQKIKISYADINGARSNVSYFLLHIVLYNIIFQLTATKFLQKLCFAQFIETICSES